MEQVNQFQKLTYLQLLQQECTLKELNSNIEDHNNNNKKDLLNELKQQQEQQQQQFPPMLLFLTQIVDEEGNQASQLFDSSGIFLDFVNIEETDENIQTLQKLADNFSDKVEPTCLQVTNHSLILELLEGTHELTVGHCISSFTPIDLDNTQIISDLFKNLQVQSWKDSKYFDGLHITLKKLLIKQQISPIVEQLKKKDHRPHIMISSHKTTLGFLKSSQLQKNNRILLLRKPFDMQEEDISSATHSSIFNDHRLKPRLTVKFDYKNQKNFCRNNNEQNNFIVSKETLGKAKAATVLSSYANMINKQSLSQKNQQQGQQKEEQQKISWIAPTKRKRTFRKEEEEEEEEIGDGNNKDQKKQTKPFECMEDQKSKTSKNIKENQFSAQIIGYEDYCEQESGQSKDCYDQEQEEISSTGQPSFFLKLKEGKHQRMLKNQHLTIEELDQLSKRKKKMNKDGQSKRSKGRYQKDYQNNHGVYNNDLSMQLNDKVRGKYVITVDQQKRKKLKGLPNRDYFIVSDEEQESKTDYFNLLSQKFQLQQLQLPEQKLRIRTNQILNNLKQGGNYLKNKIEDNVQVVQKLEGGTINKEQIKEERGSDEEKCTKNIKVNKYQLKEQQLNCKEVQNFQNNQLLEQNIIKTECSIKEECQ